MLQFIIHESGSTGNLYQVISDHQSLIIDPGISIKKVKQALEFKLNTISACLCTHSHGDHSKGIPEVTKAGIDCYMTAETASAINMNGHRTHTIKPLKQFSAGGFSVLPVSTYHDCPGSVGFLISNKIERLLFVTDSQYVHNRFTGLNIIAIECNWSKETMSPDLDPVVKKRIYNNHYSLENVKKFLSANDLSNVHSIFLIHISNGNGDPKYFKSEIQRLTGKPVYVKD